MRHRCVSSQAADSGEGVAGCVLDARQRLVDRQHVADMLCAVNTEVVVPDAANESRIDVSAGADSWGKRNMSGGILERFQRRCGRQETAQYDRPRHPNALAIQIQLFDAVLA